MRSPLRTPLLLYTRGRSRGMGGCACPTPAGDRNGPGRATAWPEVFLSPLPGRSFMMDGRRRTSALTRNSVMRVAFPLAPLACLLLAVSARAFQPPPQEPTPDAVRADEKVLLDVKVATDAPALLAYFRQLTY